MITPWQYSTGTGLGPFDNLGDYESAYLAQIDQNMGCPGAFFNSVVDPYGGPVDTWLEIPLQYYLLPTYTQIYSSNAPTHVCDAQATGSVHNSSRKLRTAFCPIGSAYYQAGPPTIGPYCSIAPPQPPAPAAPLKAMGQNSCSNSSPIPNSGGANAGSASTIAGNPCDVSNGNKYEAQVDYLGSGSNHLQFVRSYNSLADYYSAQMAEFRHPLGITWMGTYFQSLTQISTTDSQTTYTSISARRPDGRVLTFVLFQGAYVPDADVADVLVATANGFQYHTANDTIETYDASGTLLSIAPKGGSAITVNYSGGASYPTSVSNAFGHSIGFSYAVVGDGVLHLTAITDPAGVAVSYTYDSKGNLTFATYQDGTTTTYSYGASPNPRSLTTLTDESNVAYATWTYSGGRVLSSAHAAGADAYSFDYSYSNAGRLVTDPFGTQRWYGQQLVQNLYRTTDVGPLCAGCGQDAHRTYDPNGNIASRTDYNGVQTVYSYDQDRNLETSRTEAYATPRARTITTQWDPSWNQPALIMEPNRTTAFTYDDSGNVRTKTLTDTTVTPNVARTWTYTYDSYGRVLSADGPRTDVPDLTTYTYYTCTTGFQCGQLQTVTNAAGQTTTYNTYNVYGQPLTITDPNGIVTTLTYDARQRLTSRVTASETTAFDYWPTGLLKKVTLPDGSYLAYTYDAAHRLTQITDALGSKVVYTLDAMGNHTAEATYDPSNTLHRTHTRVINSLNQLSKDVNAAGTAAVSTTFGYDNNGNQTSIAAPLSRNTTNVYDELNRLKQITDPANGITQFGYDANDNLTSATDPRGLATGYAYNGFGDLKTQASPDTGATTNTYDSAGNLATSTDARGAVSTYAYDALNRVTSVAYSLSGTTDQTLSFTYDIGTNGKGHLTGASDASHSVTWGYDVLGRVTNKSQTIGSVAQSVSYGYANGDLTTLTTPSGQTVAYGYNGNHQVTSVTVNGITVLNSVTYEPLGPVNGWTWGNSTTTTRTYDTDGKISQIVSAGTKTFGYDNAFRITGITDTSAGAANWTYGYDTLDRITSGTSPSITRAWTYDANGNRQTETGTAASTYSIASSSNRISGITGALARTYAYDAAGNTTGYSTVSATYNNAGRLKTLTNGAATETSTYNALGQRIQVSGGAAGTVLYSYDEAGHLLGEYDGTGVLIEETVWLGDIPVATLRPSGSGVAIYYIHSDQLNTPRQVTRPSDNIPMWTWNSDPFGADAANANPAGVQKQRTIEPSTIRRMCTSERMTDRELVPRISSLCQKTTP